MCWQHQSEHRKKGAKKGHEISQRTTHPRKSINRRQEKTSQGLEKINAVHASRSHSYVQSQKADAFPKKAGTTPAAVVRSPPHDNNGERNPSQQLSSVPTVHLSESPLLLAPLLLNAKRWDEFISGARPGTNKSDTGTPTFLRALGNQQSNISASDCIPTKGASPSDVVRWGLTTTTFSPKP